LSLAIPLAWVLGLVGLVGCGLVLLSICGWLSLQFLRCGGAGVVGGWAMG